jgi:CheY-like chemotaxis protein
MLLKRQFVMVSTIPETETILLCDDEVGIRRLVSTILGMYGYHVLEARSGKHAMLIAEAHSGPIHLLLSDVLMPDLDGPGLAEQLRAVRPGSVAKSESTDATACVSSRTTRRCRRLYG